MESDNQKLRDEFLYNQVKSGRTMYRVLAVIYGSCTVAALVLGVLGITVRGLSALLQGVLLSLSTVLPAFASWHTYKAHVSALEEIGEDPTGIDTYRGYSKSTAELIASERRTTKEYCQLWVAYGVLTLTLLFFGLLLLALGTDAFGGDTLLLVVGVLMTAGGLLLLHLTLKAFRSWRISRRLDKM